MPASDIRELALTRVTPSGRSRMAEARVTPYAFGGHEAGEGGGEQPHGVGGNGLASAQHPNARTAIAAPIAQRRPRSNRSRNGPMSGATTAKGNIVTARNSAICPRASPLGTVKNRVPASETARAASPAALNACSSISRASPDSPAPLACEARRATWTAAVAARPEAAATSTGLRRLPAPVARSGHGCPPHARPVRSPAGRHHVRPPAAGVAANVGRRRGARPYPALPGGSPEAARQADWWFGLTVSENGAVTPVTRSPGSPRLTLRSSPPWTTRVRYSSRLARRRWVTTWATRQTTSVWRRTGSPPPTPDTSVALGGDPGEGTAAEGCDSQRDRAVARRRCDARPGVGAVEGPGRQGGPGPGRTWSPQRTTTRGSCPVTWWEMSLLMPCLPGSAGS